MLFLKEVCETSAILKVIYFVFEIINIAFMIIPIGLIIMIMVDFFKNVIASKDDEMKKNLNLAIKRIIMCIAVFLVPTVVKLLVGIVEKADTNLSVPYLTCIKNADLESIKMFENIEKIEKQQEEKEKQEKLNGELTEEETNNSSNIGTVITTDDDSTSNNNGSTDSDDDDSSSKSSTGAAKIIAEAEKYYSKIEADDDWVHKYDKDKYSHKKGHETTCCYLVSTILKKADYLKSGTLCHLNGPNSVVPYGASGLRLKKVEIIPHSKISDLKKGDVIVYQGAGKSGNIAIFDHKKSDKIYVYGASSTNEIRREKHPSTIMSSYWKDKSGKIIIVRAKK